MWFSLINCYKYTLFCWSSVTIDFWVKKWFFIKICTFFWRNLGLWMYPDYFIRERWWSNFHYRLYLSLLFSSFSNVCLLFSIVFICSPPFRFKNKLKKPLLVRFRNLGSEVTLLIFAMDRIKPILLIFQHSFKICNKTDFELK